MLIFLAYAALSGLGAALYAWLVRYKRRLTAIRATIPPTPRPSGTRWQAGRWDTDARHTYVANLGDDTAYEVTVIEDQRVIATATSVPPFSADRFTSTSAPPCYVNFCVHNELDARPPVAAGLPYRGRRAPVSRSRSRIAVQVTWRTERREWSA